jgi:hypothetical protein
VAQLVWHPDVVLVAHEVEVGFNFRVVNDLEEVLAETFLRATADMKLFDTPFFLVSLQDDESFIMRAIVVHVERPVFIILALY